MTTMIELKSYCGRLHSISINEIVSFSEQTFHNNGSDFINYTEISLKNGHKINANKEAYDLIKKYTLQQDAYYNL